MPDLGLEVLFKGKNMIRLLGGLGVALKISATAVLISLPVGILLSFLGTPFFIWLLLTQKKRNRHDAA